MRGGKAVQRTEGEQREEPPKECKRTKLLFGCDAKG